MASSPGFTGGIATPPPALQQPGAPQGRGLLDMLQQLLGGAPAPVSALGPVPESVAASAMPRPPEQAQSPARVPFAGLKALMDPSVALPIAGQLLGNRGNAANFGAAFEAMGPAMKANKTMKYLRENNPDLAKMVDSGLPITNAFEFLMEERKAQLAGVKPPQVETFYDENGQSYKAQWDQAAGDWKRVGGSKGDEGFEITTADGTTIRQGAFGNQDKKNVANRITEEQEAAAGASSLKTTVGMLRKANENVGYSGPGAGIYGAADDAAEQFGVGDFLPGKAGARATMRSGGLDVALAQVQKTKGAISNAEMGLFMAAAPGMQNTPQGNAALLDVLDAVADRQLMRTQEAEAWRQEHGTLDGFEAAWGQWAAQNPLIAEDGQGGIALTNSGNGNGLNTSSTGAKWRVIP